MRTPLQKFLTITTSVAGGVLLLALRLPAQEILTSATLPSWSSRGNPPIIDPAQGQVSVPAGAELSRLFTSDTLSVRLVSRPFFSPELKGMPALGVGPALLTFTCDKSGGALVLLGDRALSLPATFALDSEGRSQQPLDLTLDYSRTEASATLHLTGQDFTVPAAAPAGPIEVVVTAGAAAVWRLDTFEVNTDRNPKVDLKPTLGLSANIAESPSDAASQSLAEAAQKRGDLAAAVMHGEVTTAQALEKLRESGYSAWKGDGDAGFALAAVEVGEILVAHVRFAAAEPFFRAAEPAFDSARRHATKPADQSLWLKKLAWIRSLYLQKAVQAKSDIEEAYRLSPANKNLQQLRRRLASEGGTAQIR